MRNYLRLLVVLLGFGMSQAANAQTYCEYSIGFAWCGTGWEIDDITIGTFNELTYRLNIILLF